MDKLSVAHSEDGKLFSAKNNELAKPWKEVEES